MVVAKLVDCDNLFCFANPETGLESHRRPIDMPTIRRAAALGCYIVASTLLVVTLRVGPDPGEPGGGVVQQRLFEKYQATEPFVGVVVEKYQATKPLRIAYDPVIKPRRAAPPDCARATRAITGNSTYGRLNNALIELAHLLEFAATSPEPTVVVLPDHARSGSHRQSSTTPPPCGVGYASPTRRRPI